MNPTPKDPAVMTAGQINTELDRLDARLSKINQQFIDAGRGDETLASMHTKADPLALRYLAAQARFLAVRGEVHRRYGSYVSRLPKGFGPIKGI